MAAQKQKVRPSPLDDPPTASSSSSSDEENQQPLSNKSQEQEVSSDEEVSSEEDHEDDEEEQTLPTLVTKNPKLSTSESDTESGSQTESEPDVTPAKVKPLASKPMAQAQVQAQKPKAKPSSTPSKSGSKRAAENSNVTDPKRAKKKSSVSTSTVVPTPVSDEKVEEDMKKSGDPSKPRRWSEEDEINILNGVIDFTSKTGKDPLKLANCDAFHDFMRKSLDVEISKNQLKEKVRRMKKKFETIASREENGEVPNLVKAHERQAFELSKKVWGSNQGGGANGVVVEKPKSNGNVAKTPKKNENGNGSSRNVGSAKKPKNEIKSEKKSDLVPEASSELKESDKMEIDRKQEFDSFGWILSEWKRGSVLNDDLMKSGWKLIAESEKAEFEARWKKLQISEMEWLSTRSELIYDMTKLLVKALQANN